MQLLFNVNSQLNHSNSSFHDKNSLFDIKRSLVASFYSVTVSRHTLAPKLVNFCSMFEYPRSM